MKKIFTIAAGLVLGFGGLTANAAGPTPSFSGPTAQGVITATYSPLTGDEIIGSSGEADDAVISCILQSDGLTDIKIPFNGTGGYPDWTPPSTNRITVGDKTLTFDLQDVITFNGHYTLIIPAGFTTWMDNSYDWYTIDQQFTYEFDWTLGQENTGKEYIPAFAVNDNTVDITWSNVTSLAPGTTTGATVTNNSTQQVTNLAYEDYANPHIRIAEGNILRVNLGTGSTLLPAGEYTLKVPAGFVKFNGDSDTNAEISYEFKLVVFDAGTVAFYGPSGISGNPANNYSSVTGTITVEFSNVKDIKAQSALSGITVNDVEVDASNITVPGMPGNIININVTGNSGLVNGQNTLKIGENNFTLTDLNGKQGPNSDLECTFQYSGVNQKDPTVQISFNLSVATEYVDAMEENELPNAVTISYTALKDGTYQSLEVPVESSLVIAEFPYGVNVDIAPVGKYMVTNVANYSGDLIIESTTDEDGNTTGSGVADYDATWSFSIPQNPEFESTFVSVEVGVTPANVYFNFQCQDTDVTTSAQDLVTIDYGTSVNHVSTDNGYRIYLAPTGSTLKVTPIANYAIQDVVIKNAENGNVTLEGLSSYGSSYTVTDGVYSFTLGSAASGLTFLFDVEPTTKAGTDIAINFTGEDLMAFAWTFVTTKTMMSNIDVDSDEFIYTYTTPDEALDLYFIPESGFALDITCVTSSNGQAYGEITEAPSMGTGAYQVAIALDESTGAIPTDLIITVTVTQKIEEITASFTINPAEDSEIENPGKYVTVSYKTGELQGSIDVATDSGFATIGSGSVITVTPAEGYIVSDVTTYYTSATISKPSVANGAWTITIAEDPESDFASFFVDVNTDPSSAVNTIHSGNDDAVIYNLQGVKVANPVKGGIYIVNGKKVVY